ncbi:MAG TPA: HAMP domain-containing sensor histidine kinase [Patescibacteria group bacterium]|nr:HAMP domain-containing sensor histidine kinase [Patescibacteria group bacterium]
MKRPGLRLKFAFVIVALLALIFGVIAVVLIRQNSSSLRDDLNTRSKLFAALATTPVGNTFLTYQDSGQIKITQQIQNFTDLNKTIADVAVVDTVGKVAFNQHDNQTVQVDEQTATTFKPIYDHNASGIIQRIVVPLIEENGSHRYNLVYFVSSTSVEAAIHHTEMLTILFVILGLLVSILITYLVTTRLFVKPIQAVSRQALLISAGHFDQQINIVSHDEVGALAKAVNSMAESLKANIAQLREVDRLKTEFMMISSHNLRTPLTIINGYLESLQKTEVSAQLRHILDTIAVSSKRLTAFAEDMLTISQVESGKDVIQKEPTELAKLLQGMADDAVILANQKNITFTPNISLGDVKANISPAHLRGAIWNLLDNALKFTPDGGWVKLEAMTEGSNAKLSISDSGIGIAAEEMSRLFTKFHRGTSTMEYQYEGTGIGLYSTKLVIDRMGGNITAQSQIGHGATFIITLPLITEHQ